MTMRGAVSGVYEVLSLRELMNLAEGESDFERQEKIWHNKNK